MNIKRRKTLKSIIQKLTDLELEIEKVQDEEQDSFDNMPESLAATERGDQMEEFIGLLDFAREQVLESKGTLEEVSSSDPAIV